MRKLVLTTFVVGSVLSIVDCSKTQSSPSVTFTAPIAGKPGDGTSYRFTAQPVTVSIVNAVKTGPATTTYSIEVASDSGFSTKVYTKDGIAEDASGSTAVTLPTLNADAGDVNYYWHWRATVEGVASAPSATQHFVIQQKVVVNAPTPRQPAQGATASSTRPTFTAANASRQGATGAIAYLFQVSTSSSFSSINAQATVAEGPGGQNGTTSWTPNTELPATTLFWRVQAADNSNAVTSAFSSTQSFSIQPFLDMHTAQIINNPADLASWPETTKITSIDFNTGYMMVDFDKRLTGEWPESGFGVEYTLGACFFLEGQWRCSAVIQFWTGRDLEASGPAGEIGNNWYYGRWGIMDFHQPAIGELIGVFVAQGNLRDIGESTLHERSNVVLIPFGTNFNR
jgi:hypothetical protein